jgi:Asp-tRNA(Asn)/Glu-tRNA(Gln) amidotransferase A subunit family amidase
LCMSSRLFFSWRENRDRTIEPEVRSRITIGNHEIREEKRDYKKNDRKRVKEHLNPNASDFSLWLTVVIPRREFENEETIALRVAGKVREDREWEQTSN